MPVIIYMYVSFATPTCKITKTKLNKKKKVEKMIGELGQMFSRFSTMVAAQEEVVMHIEDDVEAAHAFAEEGQAHLAK